MDFEVTPPAYLIVRNYWQRRGGGTAFFIKDYIKFSVFDNSDIEMLWITTRINDRTMHIGGIFKAPYSSLDTTKLRDFMDSKFSLHDNIVLLGDINLPGINWLSQSPGTEQALSNYWNLYSPTG